VKKNQVLARLDPSLFQTQIEQAQANLLRAQADVERLRVSLDDARTKLTRAKELSGRQLIPQSELDTADVNVRSAEAQLRSSEAQVTQAQASLNQNQVNLQHTVITAPIDGLVISRNVDVGQTVAASMQAPTLFVLAADLTKMQVVANLDESDVGRIRPGQKVTFHVDAYPADDFSGTVSQVRLNPLVQQNVVTYATVIDVPNDQLKLKPGMTANVNIEIARATNVLRIANAALRFRPTNDMYAALGQTPPPAGGRGQAPGGANNGEGGSKATPQTAAPSPTPPSHSPAPAGEGAGGGSATSGGGEGSEAGAGRGRSAERMQNLSPEDRDRILARMRGRNAGAGATATAAGGNAAVGRGRAGGAAQSPAPAAGRSSGATTIDALFGPLPRPQSVGRVWRFISNQLKPVRVRLGIADGQATELLEGDLHEGDEVVTNVTTATAATRPAPGAGFPFGQPGRGGFGGQGGFPGGGGNRGAPAGGNRGR
jgi:HlyD family secretion protein